MLNLPRLAMFGKQPLMFSAGVPSVFVRMHRKVSAGIALTEQPCLRLHTSALRASRASIALPTIFRECKFSTPASYSQPKSGTSIGDVAPPGLIKKAPDLSGLYIVSDWQGLFAVDREQKFASPHGTAGHWLASGCAPCGAP